MELLLFKGVALLPRLAHGQPHKAGARLQAGLCVQSSIACAAYCPGSRWGKEKGGRRANDSAAVGGSRPGREC